MNQNQLSVLQLITQLFILGVVFLFELAAGIPILSLVLFWRLSEKMKLEQELTVVLIMALCIASLYALPLTMVWLVLALGLGIHKMTAQSRSRYDWQVLISLLVSSVLFLYLGSIAHTTRTIAAIGISYAGVIMMANLIQFQFRWWRYKV